MLKLVGIKMFKSFIYFFDRHIRLRGSNKMTSLKFTNFLKNLSFFNDSFSVSFALF